MPDRFALDSNIYVKALRNAGALARLKRFLTRAGHRIEINAVVALELRAGALTAQHERALDALFAPYGTRSRITVPTLEAFMQAGRVLAALATKERVRLAAARAGYSHDALIAASCREARVVLVTDNPRDFAAIQRHLRGFRFVAAAEALGA